MVNTGEFLYSNSAFNSIKTSARVMQTIAEQLENKLIKFWAFLL